MHDLKQLFCRLNIYNHLVIQNFVSSYSFCNLFSNFGQMDSWKEVIYSICTKNDIVQSLVHIVYKCVTHNVKGKPISWPKHISKTMKHEKLSKYNNNEMKLFNLQDMPWKNCYEVFECLNIKLFDSPHLSPMLMDVYLLMLITSNSWDFFPKIIFLKFECKWQTQKSLINCK